MSNCSVSRTTIRPRGHSQHLAWSDRGSTHSNISEPVQSLSNQHACSVCATHSNLSKLLQSLSKQHACSVCATHSNLSKLLQSLSKQQLAWSDRGSTHSSSNYCRVKNKLSDGMSVGHFLCEARTSYVSKSTTEM